MAAISRIFNKRAAPPRLYRWLLGDATLDLAPRDNCVYLTFDDGPDPEVTPWVLDQLKAQEFRATFFMTGHAASMNPGIVDRIRAEGHALGNHTYSHISCWETSRNDYLRDIEQCNEVFESGIFRPPYGQLTIPVARKLRAKYRIILWDLLTYDFETDLPVDQVKERISRLDRGSVLVFHDRQPLKKRLTDLLPFTFQTIREKGLKTAVL